jgi:hypothetical protein
MRCAPGAYPAEPEPAQEQKLVMVTKNDVFPSKYLSAADLGGKELTLKIAEAELETLKTLDGKENQKVVLYFHKQKKALPLNVTNFNSVMDITGEDDTENWPGCEITLYPTKATMGGKLFDAIRVKSPDAPEKVTAKSPDPTPNAPDPSDEIPF